ncbi:carboxypeptidase-like regulatory domain-containing protein [Hymenobacter gummosus]|uniref:Carboxypeptidase-like regulatory domain-containing protein n=1 Tax=Hymenobacter gummosus TaxID=1776032 RepID=A0A431TYU5_9BACT|nr:carboxypeptidase-like regulatory domain-containing protein [Hymenobacter gummosus]RTQ47109.1 carboxypeptidase-like regulatory domain-containing protein [Hymenobacter gummosus]
MPRLCPPLAVFLLSLLLPALAGAQVISGTVLNAQTQAPVPFATIGLPGREVGTVADELGRYRLDAAGAAPTDSVRVSSLGFRPRHLTLAQLRAEPTVALSTGTVALREVQVLARSAFRRTHTLGSVSKANMAAIGLAAGELGAQIGTIIRLKRPPSRLLRAGFFVGQDAGATVTCRLHFYRLDAKGWPTDEQLLDRELIVRAPVQRGGSVVFELADEQLLLAEDFFMAVELLKWEGEAAAEDGLVFGSLLGSTATSLYYRRTAQVAWKRTLLDASAADVRPILSFFVTVQD